MSQLTAPSQINSSQVTTVAQLVPIIQKMLNDMNALSKHGVTIQDNLNMEVQTTTVKHATQFTLACKIVNNLKGVVILDSQGKTVTSCSSQATGTKTTNVIISFEGGSSSTSATVTLLLIGA